MNRLLILFLPAMLHASDGLKIRPELSLKITANGFSDQYSDVRADQAKALGAGAGLWFNETNALRLMVYKSMTTSKPRKLDAFGHSYVSDYRAMELAYKHVWRAGRTWRPFIGATLAATSLKYLEYRPSDESYYPGGGSHQTDMAFLSGFLLGDSLALELEIGTRVAVAVTWRF